MAQNDGVRLHVHSFEAARVRAKTDHTPVEHCKGCVFSIFDFLQPLHQWVSATMEEMIALIHEMQKKVQAHLKLQ